MASPFRWLALLSWVVPSNLYCALYMESIKFLFPGQLIAHFLWAKAGCSQADIQGVREQSVESWIIQKHAL